MLFDGGNSGRYSTPLLIEHFRVYKELSDFPSLVDLGLLVGVLETLERSSKWTKTEGGGTMGKEASKQEEEFLLDLKSLMLV